MKGKRLRELGRIYEKIASLILIKIVVRILGEIEKRVFVGGSFNTWPLMDFVSRILVRLGYTVLTARYLYMTDSKRRVIRQRNTPERDESMNTYLKRLIKLSSKVVLLYTVPAGHYNETEWCFDMKKHAVGVTFVRDIGGQCPDLQVHSNPSYSECRAYSRHSGAKNSFDCIKSPPCPFKKQGIAKNIIEFFLRSPKMRLIALESLENLEEILREWIQT